jgi:signal transduction histidine kinase
MINGNFFLEFIMGFSQLLGIPVYIYFANGFLQQKKQPKWIKVAVIIGASLIILAVSFFIREDHFFLFFSFFVFLALGLILYQGKIVIRLSSVLIFFVFEVFGRTFSTMILNLVSDYGVPDLSQNTLYQSSVGVLSIFILFFIIFFLLKIMKTEIETKSVIIRGLLISIPIFSLIVCLNLHLMIINLKGSEPIGVLGGIALLYVNAVFLAIYKAIKDDAERAASIKNTNQQLELQQQHYREILKKNEEVRGLWHDMNNFQITMQYMLSENKLEELNDYLLEIRENLDQMNEHRISGNTVIDAILFNKMKRAKEHQIRFNYSIAVPETILMSNVDLSIIIGNLLDNAIEACQRDERSSEGKEIFIVIKYRKGILMIDLENTANEKTINKVQDTFISSKKNWDEQRIGFGMTNIRHVLKQYEGNIVNQVIDNRFKSTLIIPLPEPDSNLDE